jgi:hypothetical protein
MTGISAPVQVSRSAYHAGVGSARWRGLRRKPHCHRRAERTRHEAAQAIVGLPCAECRAHPRRFQPLAVISLAERRSGTVKHRNIDYDVEEVALAQWRWKIYPKIEIGPKETSEAMFGSRDAAIAACIIEINNALDGKNNVPRS